MLQKITLNKVSITLVIYFVTLCAVNVQAREYIIGVEAVRYYPLYDFTTNDTSKPSFTKELLVNFFEEKNYQYKLLALPIKRFAKAYMQSNKSSSLLARHEDHIDFKFPDNSDWYNQSPDQKKITFSQPVIELLSGSFVHKSNANIQRKDIKKLGTILGFFPTHWINEVNNKQVELQQETTPFSVVKHLLRGNIDATNINLNVINYNLGLLGKKGEIVVNRNLPHEKYAYHLSSLHYPEIIDEFNQYLNENKSLIKKLKAKYSIKDNL